MTDRFQFVSVPGLRALKENSFFFKVIITMSRSWILLQKGSSGHLGPVLILLQACMTFISDNDMDIRAAVND